MGTGVRMRRPRPAGGYTMIELVMVMVILGLLATSAGTSLTGLDASRQGSSLARLASGLAHAQTWARSTGRSTWAAVDTGLDTASFYVENPLLPGTLNRLPMQDPLNGGDYVLLFDERGAGLTSVDFGGTDEVAFGPDGEPYNALGALLAADGTVDLEGGLTLYVSPTTGLVRVVE